jgi:hypothetical protein
MGSLAFFKGSDMPTYTTEEKVLDELPSNLPTNFATNYMDEFISDGSGQVETLVGPGYNFSYESSTQKFPNISSSPATPEMIEYCARLIAASLAYAKLKEGNKLSGKDLETKLRAKAENNLESIREGRIVISLNGTNLKTNQMDHTEDQHMYPDDGQSDEPIFNDENFETYI